MGDQPYQQPDPDPIEWTDPDADALFARVEAAIAADLPAVDEAAVTARVRAVVGPEFDRLREQIQALQVSDGYEAGWNHGVQAATAHHQRASSTDPAAGLVGERVVVYDEGGHVDTTGKVAAYITQPTLLIDTDHGRRVTRNANVVPRTQRITKADQ